MFTSKTVFPALDGTKLAIKQDKAKRNKLLYGVIQVGSFIVSSGYYISRVGYDSFALIYVREGMLEVESDGEKYIAEAGDLVFHDQSKRHTQKNLLDSNLTADFLYIYGENVRDFYEIFYRAHRCLLKNYNGAKLKDTVDAVYPEIKSGNEDVLKTSSLVYALLVDLLRYCKEESAPKDEIADAVAYICAHFNEEIKMDALAKMFYMDKYYLIRKFHARTGFTPKEYVNRMRFERAKKLLKETDLSVLDIAREVGYAESKSLNALFARRIDLTPSEYRAAVRNKN